MTGLLHLIPQATACVVYSVHQTEHTVALLQEAVAKTATMEVATYDLEPGDMTHYLLTLYARGATCIVANEVSHTVDFLHDLEDHGWNPHTAAVVRQIWAWRKLALDRESLNGKPEFYDFVAHRPVPPLYPVCEEHHGACRIE